jgi:hypothetical protein
MSIVVVGSTGNIGQHVVSGWPRRESRCAR